MRTVVASLLFAATLVFVALFWNSPYLLFVLLLPVSGALVYLDGFKNWKFFILCALLGPITEIICIMAGAWEYAAPQVAGIPIWLFLVWGNAGLFFVRLGKSLGTIR